MSHIPDINVETFNDMMEISKDAKKRTHVNDLERYYICCRVKENKHIQLYMAKHLQQWIHPQLNIFQCASQNTQFIQKQLKHKMACTKTG
jgi:hypothetical protein